MLHTHLKCCNAKWIVNFEYNSKKNRILLSTIEQKFNKNQNQTKQDTNSTQSKKEK